MQLMSLYVSPPVGVNGGQLTPDNIRHICDYHMVILMWVCVRVRMCVCVCVVIGVYSRVCYKRVCCVGKCM